MTLVLDNISKKVGNEHFIYPTSFELDNQGFNVLLGATNAGKTTLIKLIAGLEKPSTGKLWLDGNDITKLNTQKRNISLVHQFFINYPHMTVYDNIASPLRVAKTPKHEIDQRVREAAAVMQLEPMLDRYTQALSGGQQQRTALARAIVKESSIILLDEPLANLDYKLREELRDQLPDIFADRGTIVVYATSDPTEALLLGGKTITLHEGRVTQVGSSSEVYHHPNSLTSAAVFSDPPINTARIRKQGNIIQLSDDIQWLANQRAQSLADGDYVLAIRPHHIFPESAPSSSSNTTAVTGRVQITEIDGSDSVAHFLMGQHNWVSVAQGIHPYEINQDHTFLIDTDHCDFFTLTGELASAGAQHG